MHEINSLILRHTTGTDTGCAGATATHSNTRHSKPTDSYYMHMCVFSIHIHMECRMNSIASRLLATASIIFATLKVAHRRTWLLTCAPIYCLLIRLFDCSLTRLCCFSAAVRRTCGIAGTVGCVWFPPQHSQAWCTLNKPPYCHLFLILHTFLRSHVAVIRVD